jgi:hypothetical protein
MRLQQSDLARSASAGEQSVSESIEPLLGAVRAV